MTDILPQIQDDAITIENISNTEINEENNYTDVSEIDVNETNEEISEENEIIYNGSEISEKNNNISDTIDDIDDTNEIDEENIDKNDIDHKKYTMASKIACVHDICKLVESSTDSNINETINIDNGHSNNDNSDNDEIPCTIVE
jgi:hypothetical protein